MKCTHAISMTVIAVVVGALLLWPAVSTAGKSDREIHHVTEQEIDPRAKEAAQQAAGACCLPAAPCPWDLNDDGGVGVVDLLVLLENWGPCDDPADCPADFDGSGSVGIADLLILLENWGPCPAPTEAACEQLTEAQCAADGGVFLGEDIGCDNVLCDPVPAALEFHQLDLPSVEDGIDLSDWGMFVLTYETPEEVHFINLAIEIAAGAPDPAWQMQNVPLPAMHIPGSIQTVRYKFDLGNTIGDTVAEVSYGMTMTELPATEPQIDRVSDVMSSSYNVWPGGRGEDIEQLTFAYRDPEPLIVPVPIPLQDEPEALQIKVNVHSNPGVEIGPQRRNACTAGSVRDSMNFLNIAHNLNIPADAIDMEAMKEAVGWTLHGAIAAWPLEQKGAWMQEQGFQIETIRTKDIEDVKQALDKNHDVEIDLVWGEFVDDEFEETGGAHTAVITGVIEIEVFGETVHVLVIEDAEQPASAGDGPITEDYEQRWIVIHIPDDDPNVAGLVAGQLTGRIDPFVIERPTPQSDKNCQQVITTLDWLGQTLQSAASTIDWLWNNWQSASDEEIEEHEQDASGKLESAAKLRGKAQKVLEALHDANGGDRCPGQDDLQEVIDTITDLAGTIEAAQTALNLAIAAEGEEKKPHYDDARDAANQAVGDVGHVMQGHFGCIRIARSLQRARRLLDSARRMAHSALWVAKNQGANGVAAIEDVRDYLQGGEGEGDNVVGRAIQRLVDAQAKIDQIIADDTKNPSDCPTINNLEQLRARLAAAIDTLMAAKELLDAIEDLSPQQQQQRFTKLRDAIISTIHGDPDDPDDSGLNGVIDDLLTPAQQEPGCGDEDAGDCCEPNETPYCDDLECCDQICAVDPFCCEVEWDGLCAEQANDPETGCEVCVVPPGCGVPGTGDCCEAQEESPYCDDLECCEMMCKQDPFCCDVNWDGLCAGAANDLCDVCF